MHSPWVAIDLAADPVAQARLLRRAHEVALSGCGTPPVLRELIVQSWHRCTAAGVDPDRPAPMMLSADEAAARFASHPLAVVTPLVRDLLGTVSAEARHLVAISDAGGTLLWIDGHPRMLEAASGPHFRPGALCSEAAVGTNAVGTALALEHAVQVFSAEHFNRLLHGWTCAAAPVRDPESGAILGVIDLSSSFRKAHPHTLALVSAVAQAAEAQLQREHARGRRTLLELIDRLSAAGRRPSALVAADGRVLASSPRAWLGGRVELRGGDGGATLPDGTRAVIEHGRGRRADRVGRARARSPGPAAPAECPRARRRSARAAPGRRRASRHTPTGRAACRARDDPCRPVGPRPCARACTGRARTR